MLGLLTITAIPTTIGIAEGISRRDEAQKDRKEQVLEQMRKFNLEAYCERHAVGPARRIHRGKIVLKGTRVYIDTVSFGVDGATPFEGFYIEYADNDRPKPLPMGMVSMVYDLETPTLNWIYVDKETKELRTGNKSQSTEHNVGPWSWEAGEDGGDGGVTLGGEEGAVAVETKEGKWQVYWEEQEGTLKTQGRTKIQISLERKMIDPPPDPDAPVTSHAANSNTTTETSKSKFNDRAEGAGGASTVKVSGGDGKKKMKQAKVEVVGKSNVRPLKDD